MKPNRRQVMQTAGAAAVALSLPNSSHAADSDLLPIIDTHQHLWDLKIFQPPWLASAPKVIASSHATPEYLKATDGLNLVKAVYMEIDVDPKQQVKEAEHVIKLSKDSKHPTVAAVISGRPNSEKFKDYISKFKSNQYIKGVRQVLHVDTAKKGFCLQPQFVKSAQLLGEMGKSLDLCMRPMELADGATLAKKCPETRFIVDHCGNADPKAWLPKDQQADEPWHDVDTWKKGIELLSKQSNVVCKISGIVARAPKGWKPDHLAPIINFCLDTFGPDRVMFGGDWPVCKIGASFAGWVNGLKAVIKERPRAEQKKLLHDNANSFYGLG